MTIRNFQFLLQPRSVALIGASARPGSVGLITARNLLAGGFAGPIWLVNPKYGSIEGQRLLSFRGRTAGRTRSRRHRHAARHCPRTHRASSEPKGTRAAVVITAGIRDELKRAMLEAARPHLLRIQGPNCLGLMLPAHRPQRQLLASAAAGRRPRVPLAVGRADHGASSIGRAAATSASRTSSRLATWPTPISATCSTISPAMRQSRAILLYMESVTNAPKFMSAARRAARAKAGHRRQGGARARPAPRRRFRTPARWRARMRAYEAAFRRAGVLRVRELDELFSAAEILARHPHARRRPARHPDQRRRRRRAGGGPARRPRRPAREPLRGDAVGARRRAAADLVARQSRRHHRRCGPGEIRGARWTLLLRERRRRRHPGHELPDGARLEHGGRAARSSAVLQRHKAQRAAAPSP